MGKKSVEGRGDEHVNGLVEDKTEGGKVEEQYDEHVGVEVEKWNRR